jgi:hypothetical protein
MVNGELRHPDIVQPGGNRHRLLPVRLPAAVPQIDGLLDQPVGHHLVFRGRRHHELARRLVRGMIDGRQPLMRQIGPVDAEKTALPEFVLYDLEPIGRNAAVLHRERSPFPIFRRREQV